MPATELARLSNEVRKHRAYMRRVIEYLEGVEGELEDFQARLSAYEVQQGSVPLVVQFTAEELAAEFKGSSDAAS